MPREQLTALLVLGTLLLGAGPVRAQQEVDFETCMANCDQHFKKVQDADGDCAKVMGNIRNDLGLVREQLTSPRLCTGKFRLACKEWADASMDALDKIRGLLENVKDCRQLNAGQLKEHLWTLTPAKACRGDSAYTDLHDYMSGNRSMVRAVSESGAVYPFEIVPIPMGDDLWGQAPYCDPPLKAHTSYVSPLVEIFVTLSSLEPWQACAVQCKEPTPEQRRLFKSRDALDAAERSLEELHAERLNRGQARSEAFEARGMRVHPCRVYATLDEQCSRIEKDLAEVRGAITELLPQQTPGTEAILTVERRIEGLDVQISQLDIEALAQACDEEDQLAVQFEERRRALIDKLQRTGDISLEAFEAFDRLGRAGGPCEYTLDCNLPMLCQEGRCASKVSMEEVLDIMGRSKVLEAEALAYEIYDPSGLREAASPALDSLEGRLKGLRRQLLDLGWEGELANWRDAFRTSVDVKVNTLTKAAEETLSTRKDIPREQLQDPIACRRSIRELESLVSDLRAARKVLGNEDPVTNPRWVSVQLSKVTKSADALDAAQAACEEHCLEAEPETDWMIYAGAAAGGIFLLVILGFVVFRKRLLTGR
ncbi:MAG: hypothetical protein ABIK09_07990 [Pseudomonadota bacterium]